ncbi:glycoside hydrolase domain-containing protein [Actinoplanes sp. NPDC049599]|uniref:glycoside hydrolase domain-containing protein n=1 Tax=Actinoplanes sp. NPDC049599 TaxID=3363903 RepID=UPI00379301C6
MPTPTPHPPRRRPAVPRWARSRRALTAAAAVVTTVLAGAVVGIATAETDPSGGRDAAVAAVRAKLAGRAKAKEPGLSPGTYRGKGFDACTAPSAAQMTAWAKSPYRALVVYFGGVGRGCKQPNLTASWVRTQKAAGWKLIPIYVGPQAPCTTTGAKHRITVAKAAAEGTAAASDAVAKAKALGMARDSVLIYDMEKYAGDAACKQAVLTFLSAWTVRLHDLAYLSGVYGDAATTVAALVKARGSAGFVAPDHIDFARWDGVAALTDAAVPAGHWPGKRRMKQYKGPHKETYGGVTITVDNDYLDVAPLPETLSGDISGNGWSDVLAVDPAGAMTLWRGNGTSVGRVPLAGGWQDLDVVTRGGDFTGDGREDVIARDRAGAALWLYPSTGSGFGPRVRIGSGWGALQDITMAGDLTGDGRADVVAVQPATGRLMLYPGRGTGFSPALTLGTGDWRGLDELTGVGDVDGDGIGDLVARVEQTGVLRLYSGWGRQLATYREIHADAAGLAHLTGAGDFDRDGTPDLLAVDTATGTLVRYPIQAAGLGTPVPVAPDLGAATVL